LKTKFLLFFLYVTFSFLLKAQQPSHYFIGVEELSGIDIYSIAQDDSANIWLSSNKGLLKYNGYEFNNLKNKTGRSNALFGLKKDNLGNLYCCNLNGQIFTVKNDSLYLAYQIPDSLLANLVHFNFDNNNQLVFCTKNYYSINAKSEVQLIFPSKYANAMAKTKQGELVLVDYLNERVAYYKSGRITHTEKVEFRARYPFSSENELYLTLPSSSKVYKRVNNEWSKIEFENDLNFDNQIVNFYPITDSLLSFAFKNRGISFYNNNGKLKYTETKLFPKHRVSCILRDREGNIWLPTLGKGIIILPNMEVIDYNNHPLLKEDDIQTITSDSNGNVYVGGINGVVYTVKNQKVSIVKEVDSRIEFLGFLPDINSILYNNYVYSLDGEVAKKLDYPFAKDVAIVDSIKYLFATNKGLYSSKISVKKSVTVKSVVKLTSNRTFCVAYDKKRKEIWAGTIKGVQLITETEKKFVYFNNNRISVTDIECINNQIWISTLNSGVLIFENGVFSHSFPYTDENNIRIVKKLKYVGGKLYFTTEKGLTVYNFITRDAKSFSKTKLSL
jgi:ligand-binding sensor domain-containing protein